MAKIEAKLLLYDHNSRLNSFCSEEEALTSDTKDIKLNIETHKMLKKKNSRTYQNTLMVEHGPRRTKR